MRSFCVILLAILILFSNNIYSISHISKEKYLIKDLKIFALKERLAENIVNTVKVFLSPNGKLSIDHATNSLIINDIKKNLDIIEKIIKKIDTKTSTKQIIVESIIVETNTNNNKDLGISWELRKELRPSEAKNVQSSISNNLPFSLNDGTRINIGTLNTDDFNILLQYLKSKEGTNILSSPRVTILDNGKAKIMVGNKIPYVKTTTSENVINKDINFLDVGVKLNVGAQILPNNKIKLKLHPEVSSFVSWSPADNQPIIDIREAETSVIIKDKTTIVIGGLMQEKLVRNTEKIPGISNIPFIGKIFRKTQNIKTNVELLIFITPTLVSTDIIKQPDELASMVKVKKILSDIKE